MIQKSSMWRTAEVFFISPTKPHYLADISRRIELAHTSVSKNLTSLKKQGIIDETKEMRGGRAFSTYKASIDSPVFRKYKKIHNFMAFTESGIAQYIQDIASPKAIILFGSYQRGEDTEESDIDIFVECSEINFDLIKFQKKLGRKIQVHYNEAFTNYPKELKNNIINGVVVSGFLEVYK